jgi:hypothetical protein
MRTRTSSQLSEWIAVTFEWRALSAPISSPELVTTAIGTVARI